ncbi:hypothetical protein HDV00_001764 [Rhizophlyctis rosea]|nr:hypothetical protein HDV00_001764 [Rhizophlyctis rosea]
MSSGPNKAGMLDVWKVVGGWEWGSVRSGSVRSGGRGGGGKASKAVSRQEEEFPVANGVKSKARYA